MSTVLIYTSPARGHLYPMMDVAIALRERGHRVVVQTLAGERDVVLAEGLEHRPINAAIEALPLDDHQGRNPLQQLRRTLDCWAARAPFEVTDLRSTVEDVEPDVVVVDGNSWGAAAFAESLHRPWAMFLPYVLPLPSPDTPAFGPGFAPPRNALERLRDRLVWALQYRAGRAAVRSLNDLRRQLGVSEVKTLPDVFLRADRLLYRTAEPFEYPRTVWPDNVRMIGPGLWAPPAPAPDWLDELPRPRVLVGVSTEFQDDSAIITAALAAFGDGPGSLVVTTASLDPDQFGDVGDRVRLERFLPHVQVIPQVDVVVTHGGMGTVQRSLAAGVPLCVVPWGRDQSESARRVQRAGAGSIVPRSKLTPARLAAAVAEALAAGPGARRISDAFTSSGGGVLGAELVEELMETSTSAAAPGRIADSL